MTSYNERPDWADLAEQASKEIDPQKLSALVEQLCVAIDKKPGLNGDAPAIHADSQLNT